MLERPAARRYFAEGAFAADYDVHCYLRREEYLAMPARHGAHPVADTAGPPADPKRALRDVEACLPEIEHALARLHADHCFSAETRAAIDDAVRRYLAESSTGCCTR